jgi:hypothetical protein
MSNLFSQFDQETEERDDNPFTRFDMPVGASETSIQGGVADQATPIAETTPNPPQTPSFRQFSTDQYNGLSWHDQVRLYNEYQNDPNTSNPPLGFGYAFQTNPETGRRTYIPPPQRGILGGGGGMGLIDNLALGGVSAIGGVLEGVGATIDAGARRLGYETNTQGPMGNFLPRLETGTNMGESLIAETAPILLGGVAGGAGALRLFRSYPTIVKGLAAYVASEVGASSLSPLDSGGFLIGDRAMLPILRGVDLSNPTEAEQIVQDRMNLLMDGLMTGGIITRTASGAISGTKLVYDLTLGPVLNLARATRATEDRAVNAIFDQLGAFRPGMSEQEQYAFRRELTDIIRRNREVLLERLDGVDDSLTVNMDTLGSLLRGIDTPEASELYGLVQGLRTAAISGNQPLTSAATRRPQQALDTQTDALLERVGGDTADEQTARMLMGADGFAEQGREAVRGAALSAQEARAAYDQAIRDFLPNMGDNAMSAEIQALLRARGTEVNLPATATRDQIIEEVRRLYEIAKEGKNARYAAISGGALDIDGMYGVLRQLDQGQITQAENATQATNPLRRLLQESRPRNVDDPITGTSRMETPDEAKDRFADFLTSEGMDFGRLYTEVRPELASLIDHFSGPNGNPAIAANFRRFVNWIDEDQLQFLIRNGDEAVAEQAEIALDFYKREFAPFWRDGALQDFARIHDSTLGRTGSDGLEIGRTDFSVGSRQTIGGALEAADPAQIEQFRRLLETPNANVDAGVVADYMVYRAIGDMATAIRSADITAAPIDQLTVNLQRYADALNAQFPERATELNQFIRRVEAAQGDLTEVRRIMDEADAAVREAQEAVQNSELANFFRGFPDMQADPLLRDLSTTNNAFNAFERIFQNGRDSFDIVDALMDRVRLAPEGQREILQQGIETAYARYMRNMVVNRGAIPGDIQATSAPRIQAALEGTNPVFEIGDRIFRDRPEIMRAVRELSEFAADSTRARNAPPIAGQSPTAFNAEVTAATNRIIYTTMGPLTRMGTRMRALINSGVERVDPTNLSREIMDRILSNPDEFIRIARRIEREPSDPMMQMIMYNSFIRAVQRPVLSGRDDRNYVGEALQGAAGLELQMDQMLDGSGVRQQTYGVERQMQDALQDEEE